MIQFKEKMSMVMAGYFIGYLQLKKKCLHSVVNKVIEEKRTFKGCGDAHRLLERKQ